MHIYGLPTSPWEWDTDELCWLRFGFLIVPSVKPREKQYVAESKFSETDFIKLGIGLSRPRRVMKAYPGVKEQMG